MSSISGKVLAILAAGFFFGLALIYTGIKRFILVQKIRNTPTSKVDAAAIGLVELFGKAECHDHLASPISNIKCAYWRVVGEYYKSGKHGGWRTICTLNSSTRFYLQDETGKMLVDPNGAQIDIPLDKTFSGYISKTGLLGMQHTQLPPDALNFINSLEPAKKQAFMNHTNENVRISEYYIAEGDPLFVLGNAETLQGVTSAIGYENLILKKGNTDKTMYISDTNERKILERMSKHMYLQVFGGLALSAICLLIILVYIGIR